MADVGPWLRRGPLPSGLLSPQQSIPLAAVRDAVPPVPITRRVPSGPVDRDGASGSQQQLAEPSPDAPACEQSHTMSDHPCPDSCGFRLPDKTHVCSFFCVNASRCRRTRGRLTYPDGQNMVCSRCPVHGCSICPTQDTCKVCYLSFLFRYYPGAKDSRGNPSCVLRYGSLFHGALAIVIASPVVTLAAWFASLHFRPVINADVLARAAIHSDRMKLRDHRRHSHNWYPFKLNLLLHPDKRGGVIGGLGLMLHFRFQIAIVSWACFALGAWLITTGFETELLHSGDDASVTNPLEVYAACKPDTAAKAQQGKLRREGAMLAYTVVLYVVTSLGALIFACWQKANYIRFSGRVKTMQDFALFLTGFPKQAGEKVEEQRVEFVRQACRRTPVGVSVCWDFRDCCKEVQALVAQETFLRQRYQTRDSIKAVHLRYAKLQKGINSNESVSTSTSTLYEDSSPCPRCFRRLGGRTIQKLAVLDPVFIPPGFEVHSNAQEMHPHGMEVLAQETLVGIQSTAVMCVVFNSEEDRNIARECFSQKSRSTLFKGRYPISVCGLDESQPLTVLWNNLGTFTKKRRSTLAFSIVKLLVGICAWACLYIPWAAYVFMQMDRFGEMPSFLADSFFSCVVILGNQLMYILCNKAAQSVAFTHTGERDTLYMVLYSVAVLVNCLVDMLVLNMIALKMASVSGTQMPPQWIRHFRQAFLSSRLWKYNCSCFVVPFLVEPLVVYILPTHLASRLIVTRNMEQTEADEVLQPPAMDLSRYQDILLNVTQAILALFFEPSYLLRTWVVLLLGSVFIYVWDCYKVVRVVRAFDIASYLPDLVAQRLSALPCSLLAACVAYRTAYCWSLYSSQDVEVVDLRFAASYSPVIEAGLAALLHLGLHMLVLKTVLGWTQRRTTRAPQVRRSATYKETATEIPANYFNTNPVHTLRSRFIHKHNPPCIYYVHGKEHLLQANPDIGQYYQARRWDDKRQTFTVEMTSLPGAFRKVRRNQRKSLQRENGILASGMLWKLNSVPAELLAAEQERLVRLEVDAVDSNSFTDLMPQDGDPGVQPLDGHGRHLPILHGDLAAGGAVPWRSLGSWRWRLFKLRDLGSGSADMLYLSEKGAEETSFFTIQRCDPTLRVEMLPEIFLEPMTPHSEAEYREGILLYECAFEMGPRETGPDGNKMDLPQTLYPLAITWTDSGGEQKTRIVAHEDKERCAEWLGHLRLFWDPNLLSDDDSESNDEGQPPLGPSCLSSG